MLAARFHNSRSTESTLLIVSHYLVSKYAFFKNLMAFVVSKCRYDNFKSISLSVPEIEVLDGQTDGVIL